MKYASNPIPGLSLLFLHHPYMLLFGIHWIFHLLVDLQILLILFILQILIFHCNLLIYVPYVFDVAAIMYHSSCVIVSPAIVSPLCSPL